MNLFVVNLYKLNKNISRITLDAFSYCLLAEGKLDAVIESNLKIYDVAAIIPIVENAGGFITTWKNKNAEKRFAMVWFTCDFDCSGVGHCWLLAGCFK